jgi:hypothetical protein
LWASRLKAWTTRAARAARNAAAWSSGALSSTTASAAYTQADIGATARAITDNEVAKTSTNNIVVGTVVELLDGNRVRIRIDNHTV